MAIPQSPDQMAASVDGIASQMLGQNPAAAAAPAAPAAPVPQAASPTEDAQTVAAPTTEDDKAGDEAVEYAVAVEIEGKPYTKQQLEGMMGRYKNLNYRNAQLKPVMSVIEAYMKENPNRPVDQIASDLAALAKGGSAQPQMGQANEGNNPQVQVSKPPGDTNEDVSSALKEWAKKNALDDLPPGVETILSMGDTSQAVNGRMDQMEAVLQQILPMLQGGMDAMKQQNVDVNQRMEQNRQQTIAVNIDRAQQALNIPDDQAPQFETWMQMFGLTFDDFVDQDDAMKYMGEFDRSLKSNNYDQLKSMTEKRLAYTGGLGSTPSAQGAPAAPAGGDRLGAMADKIMSARNMG